MVIKIEMMHIPSGVFTMGSPTNESDGYDDEEPVHHVTIPKAFYLGKYQVTQKQWYEVMGDNPSHFKGDDLPVENVSWNDVQEFIQKLNEKENTHKYRLPSEAEWEYAARAGTTTRYFFGDDGSKLGEYAWFDENSGDKTHPVGKKEANPWGLYDVHGNVLECVQDTYHGTYSGAPTDGSVWEDGVSATRVNRGGSWLADARSCQSTYRNFDAPGIRYYNHGFRLVRDVDEPKPYKPPTKQEKRKKIRIETKKIVGSDGSKERMILGIYGAHELEYHILGRQCRHITLVYNSFERSIMLVGFDTPGAMDITVGRRYTEKTFQRSLKEIQKRLNEMDEVNRELERRASQWQGKETFEI